MELLKLSELLVKHFFCNLSSHRLSIVKFSTIRQLASILVELDTGCTEGFSDVEKYEENVYKMTNSLTVFYALKIVREFVIL